MSITITTKESNQNDTKPRNISYDMRLRERGLTTPETKRLRGDQIEVFKIFKGYENIDRIFCFC